MNKASEFFTKLVSLYRLLDCPELKNNTFTTEATATLELINLLRFLWSAKGRGCEFELNNEDSRDDGFPSIEVGKSLSLTVRGFSTEKTFFFKNTEAWIDGTPTLKKGNFSPNTYLIEEDLIVTEGDSNEKVSKVLAACQLIEKLSQLAHFHDEKKGLSDAFRLVFVMPDQEDKVYHPVTLETQLSSAILELETPNLSILSNILDELQNTNNIHAAERLSVFRIAVAEIIEKIPKEDESVTYLIRHWNDVADSFEKSWESYLSGFSFSKLKIEIAEQQAVFSQKLTDTVASLSGKLFSLPVSIAAVVLLEKTDSPIANVFYLISSLLVSFMVANSVKMQKKNLSNVKSSYEMVFFAFEGQNKQQITNIQKELDGVTGELNDTVTELEDNLNVYSILAWAPLITAFVYLVYTLNNKVELMVYLQCMLSSFQGN